MVQSICFSAASLAAAVRLGLPSGLSGLALGLTGAAAAKNQQAVDHGLGEWDSKALEPRHNKDVAPLGGRRAARPLSEPWGLQVGRQVGRQGGSDSTGPKRKPATQSLRSKNPCSLSAIWRKSKAKKSGRNLNAIHATRGFGLSGWWEKVVRPLVEMLW